MPCTVHVRKLNSVGLCKVAIRLHNGARLCTAGATGCLLRRAEAVNPFLQVLAELVSHARHDPVTTVVFLDSGVFAEVLDDWLSDIRAAHQVLERRSIKDGYIDVVVLGRNACAACQGRDLDRHKPDILLSSSGPYPFTWTQYQLRGPCIPPLTMFSV